MGKAARLELTMPAPAPHTAERSAGRLVVYAPESLRVNPDKTVGLRSISFKEAFEGIRSAGTTSDKPPIAMGGVSEQPVLAFAYGDEPAALTLAAERRKPQVTVRQLLVARVEEGVVKYDFTFFYNVLYSGVKSLRIDVPAEVAAGLRVVTPGIHEKTIDPPPADLAKGDVAWSLSGDSEFIGDGQIKLTWEKRIEKTRRGQARRFGGAAPEAAGSRSGMGADRPGQVGNDRRPRVGRAEIACGPSTPSTISWPPVASAARAFEFHDDWSLAVAATRYEMEKVKQTSIERALVRMVVTPANQISVQALYRMRSARQRLTVELPAGADFDAQPLRLNGRPAPLEMGKQDEYFVPLADVKADTPFVLELRYRLPRRRPPARSARVSRS